MNLSIKKFLQLFSVFPSKEKVEYDMESVYSTYFLSEYGHYGEDLLLEIEKNLLHESITQFHNRRNEKLIKEKSHSPHEDVVTIGLKVFIFSEDDFYEFLTEYTESILKNERSQGLVVNEGEEYLYKDDDNKVSRWILDSVNNTKAKIISVEGNFECVIPRIYFENNFYKNYEVPW